MSNAQYKITLKKSLIGRKVKHIRTAEALGLTRINKTVVKPKNKAIEGMVDLINYLVVVEEM